MCHNLILRGNGFKKLYGITNLKKTSSYFDSAAIYLQNVNKDEADCTTYANSAIIYVTNNSDERYKICRFDLASDVSSANVQAMVAGLESIAYYNTSGSY
ncbi:hypothetical protein A1E_03880 [Rickettsia canadensis str. McKiel]|uniref:Uncharacterized protein n=1 Tax=Rickettsia canadensis (strain McKiel) TaxID=293613 RepID=A8EZC0_RICCK|nr:hypothetical protein [Rickettsia canadensis]ABV73703.1 hypothetical protein A1E_03880 [Rickettsia canadensis str. McKiel]